MRREPDSTAETIREASYTWLLHNAAIDRQVWIDPGVIVDVTADGRAVGIEVIGQRTVNEVWPAVLAKARFPKGGEPDG